MTYPKIKPCPKCASADMSMYGYGSWGTTWHVECDDCNYMGPGDNKLNAIRRHNELCQESLPPSPLVRTLAMVEESAQAEGVAQGTPQSVVERLRDLLAKASARPWTAFDRRGTLAIMKGKRPGKGERWPEIISWAGFDSADTAKYKRRADLHLIVQAVNALPNLLERIETLEAALKPFAAEFKAAGVSDNIRDSANWDDVDCCRGDLSVGDFRKARSTLSPEGEGK